MERTIIDTFEDSRFIYNVYARSKHYSAPYVVQWIDKRTGLKRKLGSFPTINQIYNLIN